jgi:hypothetical protein
MTQVSFGPNVVDLWQLLALADMGMGVVVVAMAIDRVVVVWYLRRDVCIHTYLHIII